MKSRYDFMKPSTIQDEETKEFWPDALTFNTHTFSLTSPLTSKELTDIEVQRFWKLIEDVYGVAEYDDVILELNGIPHKNFVSEGDTLYFPAIQDIEDSFSSKGSV